MESKPKEKKEPKTKKAKEEKDPLEIDVENLVSPLLNNINHFIQSEKDLELMNKINKLIEQLMGRNPEETIPAV